MVPNQACIDSDKVCDLSDDCGDLSDETGSDCEKFIKETFEDEGDDPTNLGIFTQDSLNATFKWLRGAGRSQNLSTGPPFDHTTFNPTGNYAYILSSARTKDDVAVLVSPHFKVPEGTQCEMSMWYFMHGKGVGTLSLFKR